MMTLQIVLIRLGGLAFGASHFTFSMVVAVFVLCIALGSFGVSVLPRVSPPRTTIGSELEFLRCCPSFRASRVRVCRSIGGSPKTPRIPSVPNSFTMSEKS